VNDEEQVPDLSLALDEAIVNATEQRWLKVARVAFDAINAGRFSIVDEQVQLDVRRMIALVRREAGSSRQSAATAFQ